MAIGCDTRHCTSVQCCRVPWSLSLLLLLLQLPLVFWLPVEHGEDGDDFRLLLGELVMKARCGEVGGGVHLLSALTSVGDTILSVVIGGELVTLSTVVAGGRLVLPSVATWW